MVARAHNPNGSKYSTPTLLSHRPKTVRGSSRTKPQSLVRRRRGPRPFPQELIDRIIDCLKDQQDFLIKCSTVSRAFVRRSQQHLFNNITLYPSLERKLKTLFENSPHLAAYVKDLAVAISISNHTQLTSPLIAILPSFDHLKSLTIRTYGGGVIDWENDILGVIHHAFQSVFVGNELEQFVLQDIQNFNPLLPAMCPSLRVLVIGGEGSLAPYTALSFNPVIHAPSITAMMIGSGKYSFQSLIDCCSSYPCPFTLDKLQWLSLREASDPSWSAAFIQLAYTSLSMLRHLVIELEIKSVEGSETTVQADPVDLSYLRSLTSIELRNSSLDHDQTLFSKRVARILCSLPQPSQIFQVTLYCPGYQFAPRKMPSSGLQWRDLNTALSSSHSPFLRQVHFKFGLNIFPLSPNLLPHVSSRGVVLRVSKMLRPV